MLAQIRTGPKNWLSTEGIRLCGIEALALRAQLVIASLIVSSDVVVGL